MTNGNNGGVGVAFPSGNRLDLLVDQIGRLTEQIAESNLAIINGFAESRANMENGFAETRANIEKLGEKIDSGFSELKTIAQAQQKEMERIASSIDKLAETVAGQAETAARQAETAAKQAETVAKQAETTAKQAQTVDRLALMLERFMTDRVQNNN